METSAPNATGWRWQMRYAGLPPALFREQAPVPVADPQPLLLNAKLAQQMGLDPKLLDSPDNLALFAGNASVPGITPIAQAYAGHQFGHFTMLGDGRQVLLGEHLAPDGRLLDVALKGSGRTPYSRSGDGRAALGPMLREYLISEAMAAFGVPTTRSLAVMATGEPVYREEVLPGAILTRIAASHIRVGTVQYAATLHDHATLATLLEHARERHDPQLAPGDYAGQFTAIMQRQARLVAQWMALGFIHGVMNTDNMALSGESIDYGPCAFMDAYDPATVFSSIDRHGRYAWGQQARIAHWNLARLAEAMLPLFDPVSEAALDKANTLIADFPERFTTEWLALMRAKLGLAGEDPGDQALVEDLQTLMLRHKADWTLTFRALADNDFKTPPPPLPSGEKAPSPLWGEGWGEGSALAADPDFAAWHTRLQQRQSPAAIAGMRAANPAIIPRNHRVEEALAAAQQGDLAPFHRLLDALSRAYDDDPRDADYRTPQSMPGYRTFCGT